MPLNVQDNLLGNCAVIRTNLIGLLSTPLALITLLNFNATSYGAHPYPLLNAIGQNPDDWFLIEYDFSFRLQDITRIQRLYNTSVTFSGELGVPNGTKSIPNLIPVKIMISPKGHT